ncbi:CocE/NonD family hydrolase [Nannocystis sp. ILAH1]|uniref:CocE/NonD family hydrolase n=1 Tax=Nannocystis sp. ILAH1 TaxID=2996789 RepID=UPI002270EC0C|nr:CocE/NonD family hydrolase [Nannocystis sp. ILAH1]MCY0989422.1 CocE/NonD family hydrolase [Nannocystis sp. ILAH1]
MSLSSRLIDRLAKLPPPLTRDVQVERGVTVPMRDGVVLRANIHTPRGPAIATTSLPTVLVRTPYGRRGFAELSAATPLAQRGFRVVVQAVRGTNGSGGVLDPFGQEGADGVDTVRWIEQQPWFDGRLGTFGASYYGFTQWALAREAGATLKALCLQATASQFRDQTYAGEGYSLDATLSWTQLMSVLIARRGVLAMQLFGARRRREVFEMLPLTGLDHALTGECVDFWQAWLAHDAKDDPYWTRARDFSEDVAHVAAPVQIVTGWYDIFLPWTLQDHAALVAAGRSPQLYVGPFAHADVGLMAAGLREGIGWLREHLLGERGAARAGAVRVCVMTHGTNGVEREFSAWPPAGAHERRFHLQPGGALAEAPPPASQPDRFRYDPVDPTPSVGGVLLGREAGARDNRALEARADVCTYTSAPLERDLEIVGPVRAEVFFSSSTQWTDVFVRLCDVQPSGRSLNVCDGLLRLTPGRVEKDADGVLRVPVELWPTAYRFPRGHRLRVQVASGAHPRFVRNLGTGEPLASGTRMVVAEQQVHHDPVRPSAIVLPVLEG